MKFLLKTLFVAATVQFGCADGENSNLDAAGGAAENGGRKLVAGGGGTPDGETPAVESVCNSVADGKAKGLCVAYCEAKDCHIRNHKSCDKIKANFEKLTGQSRLPCEVCRCWDSADLDAVTEANLDGTTSSCTDLGPSPAVSVNLQSTDGFLFSACVGIPSSEICGHGDKGNSCKKLFQGSGSGFLDGGRSYQICVDEIFSRCNEIAAP